jgi:uncharacterized repeat protein (TIGR01451 family)
MRLPFLARLILALLASILGAVAGSTVSAQTVSLGLSVLSSPVRAGERAVYAVTVSNRGSSSTGSFTLTATVPPFTSVAINEVTPGASCSTGTTPCTAGQELRWTTFLTPGQSVTFLYSALINTSTAPGTSLSTTATAAAFGLATSAQAVVASSSGLNLTLRDAPSVVAAGGSFTYTLTYGNAGSSSINTQLQLPLPPGVTFVAASDGGTNSSGTVLWNLGSLPPGAAGRRSVTVQVAAGTASGALIGASAQLRETSTQAELARAGVITTVSTVAPLEVAASASPDPVLPGQRTTYTATVSNRGTASSGSFTLTATVPPFTSVAINEATPGAACSTGTTPCTAGQELRWTTSLTAGQSRSFAFAALVTSTSPPPFGTTLSSTFNAIGFGATTTAEARIGTEETVGDAVADIPIPAWALAALAILLGARIARRRSAT